MWVLGKQPSNHDLDGSGKFAHATIFLGLGANSLDFMVLSRALEARLLTCSWRAFLGDAEVTVVGWQLQLPQISLAATVLGCGK